MLKIIRKFKQNGFTMMTMLITLGVVILLTVSVFIVADPARRVGQANDTRRWSDITNIAKAVELYQIDNHALPSELSSSTVNTDQKVVLCDTYGEVTCGDDTYGCMVISDTTFLGGFLKELPIAPGKASTTDTGYYITRKDGDKLAVGSCSKYGSDDIEMLVKASLPAYDVTCGDGVREGTEVCDDGDTNDEGCGSSTIETAGTYCNKWCTTIINVTVDEKCDSDLTNSCYDFVTRKTYYSGEYISGHKDCGGINTMCTIDCQSCAPACLPPP